MPCNSRIAQAVDLGKLNESVLDAALVAMSGVHLSAAWFRVKVDGIERSVRIVGGRLFSYDLSQDELSKLGDQIKRAYAAEAVKVAAKRCGWSVSRSIASPNKLTLRRG